MKEVGGYFSSEITVDSYPIGAAFSSGFTMHDVSDQYGVKELYAAQRVYIHPHNTNGMYKGISSFSLFPDGTHFYKLYSTHSVNPILSYSALNLSYRAYLGYVVW